MNKHCTHDIFKGKDNTALWDGITPAREACKRDLEGFYSVGQYKRG